MKGEYSNIVTAAITASAEEDVSILVVAYEPPNVTLPKGAVRRMGPPTVWVMPNGSRITFNPLTNDLSRTRAVAAIYHAVCWTGLADTLCVEAPGMPLGRSKLVGGGSEHQSGVGGVFGPLRRCSTGPLGHLFQRNS